ncbi:helix-turn-helix domain-containing protein, partial [Mycoplasma mycoides]
LTESERYIIEKMHNDGYSISNISCFLKRNKSTISRELRRNLNHNLEYTQRYASYKYKNRRNHKHIFKFTENSPFKEFTDIFFKIYNKRFFGVKATYNFIKINHNVKTPSIRTVFNWIKTNKWSIKKKID